MNVIVGIMVAGALTAGRGPAVLDEDVEKAKPPYEIAGPMQYGDHRAQTLQVNFYPDGPPRPAMIYVFSGGWHSAPLDTRRATPKLYNDLGMSYIVMTHRTGWKNAHPAQVDDVTAGLRYVKEHATEWNIDPERLAMTGTSSGAHLAMMTAYRADSPRVACVVSRGGPTDFDPEFLDSISPELRPHFSKKMKALYGEAHADPETARAWAKAFSPVTHMSKDVPPTLFIAVRKDPLPPPNLMLNYSMHHPSFAEHGYKTLKAAGGEAELALVESGPTGQGADGQDAAEAAFLKLRLLAPGERMRQDP